MLKIGWLVWDEGDEYPRFYMEEDCPDWCFRKMRIVYAELKE